MKINTFKYFGLDALKSVKRNKTLSIAAIITVLITFFIFGTFTLLGLNFNKAVEDVASKVEIKVFLKDDINLLDKKELEIKLKEQPGVKETVFESKDDAFKNFKEMLKDNPGLLQGYDLKSNPIPSSYIVKLQNPESAQAVTEAIKNIKGVESISNQKEMINKIGAFVKGVRIVGLVLFIVFIGVSIFLITNTTKITVYSRRKEIEIMKLVGATDWFIRWPFIMEAIMLGVIGSLLASGIIYGAYRWVFGQIVSNMFMVNLIAPRFVLQILTPSFILGGVVIGAIGSFVALRRFLDV